LQNVIKIVISSSPGLAGGSSGFKDFLDSPVKPGNDGKGIIERSLKLLPYYLITIES
jgi:hypothetical protein